MKSAVDPMKMRQIWVHSRRGHPRRVTVPVYSIRATYEQCAREDCPSDCPLCAAEAALPVEPWHQGVYER